MRKEIFLTAEFVAKLTLPIFHMKPLHVSEIVPFLLLLLLSYFCNACALINFLPALSLLLLNHLVYSSFFIL